MPAPETLRTEISGLHPRPDGATIPQLPGVVSKTADAPYVPGNRGLWRKAKWLNRQEFVIVGWSDPEGTRPHLGALLLGYYTDDGKLMYAGRVGTGKTEKHCNAEPSTTFHRSLSALDSRQPGT